MNDVAEKPPFGEVLEKAVADGPRAYLAWRVRPHFEAVADGFVLRSAFAVQPAIGDITRARLGIEKDE